MDLGDHTALNFARGLACQRFGFNQVDDHDRAVKTDAAGVRRCGYAFSSGAK
jgi:hypothetical protein